MAERVQPAAGVAPSAAARFRILVLNQIAAKGLERFPKERYQVGKGLDDPDAILVRSADLHGSPDRQLGQGGRPRRGGNEQHPGQGDERPGHPGLQCPRARMPMR